MEMWKKPHWFVKHRVSHAMLHILFFFLLFQTNLRLVGLTEIAEFGELDHFCLSN